MPVAQNILKLSETLYWVATALIVVLPFAVVIVLARDVMSPEAIATRFPGLTIAAPDSRAVLFAGLVGFLPLAAAIYALVQMRGLFGRYRQGEILTPACAAHVQGIGQGLFALAALGLVANTLQILILTWGNPEGQRQLSIGISSDMMGFLLSGALMVLIGRVMREAARVAEENESFV